MTKEEVLAFIKTKTHTVIATTTPQQTPEAAFIGFGETDNLELIFGTLSTTRKYKNLQENKKVAFVIGGEERITVQYEGLAEEINQEEQEDLIAMYHQKVPAAAMFKSNPDQTYWKVQPIWIRYSDFSGEEKKVIEFTF